MTTTRIAQESYIDEYASTAPTTRLDAPSAALDAYLPQRPAPLILLLLVVLSAPLWIAYGAFRVGYAVGYAAGALQPWVDARGWVVLLFIALGAPILIIATQGRKTYTYSDL